MTLSEAERALTLAQAEHFTQRVILCRDKQLGARAADIDPLTLLEEGKQRLRDCAMHLFGVFFRQIPQTDRDHILLSATDMLNDRKLGCFRRFEKPADLLRRRADRTGHARALLAQSGLRDHLRHAFQLRKVVRDAMRRLLKISARAVSGIQHALAAQQAERLAPGLPAYAEHFRHTGLGRYFCPCFERSIMIQRKKFLFCAQSGRFPSHFRPPDCIRTTRSCDMPVFFFLFGTLCPSKIIQHPCRFARA